MTDDTLPANIPPPTIAIQQRLISDRPGCRTWKITLADERTIAVKHTTGLLQLPTAAFAAREAAVLTNLAPAPPGRLRHHHNRLLARGHLGRRPHDRALPAPPAGTAIRRTPRRPTSRHHACAGSRRRLAARRPASRPPALPARPARPPARLLDWTFGHSPAHLADLIPPVVYRGGYAHLVSPGTAAELLDTPAVHSVALTEAADMYSLGALIFSSWSRQWPCDYGIADPRLLTAPQIYAAITDPSNRRPVPSDWPDVARIVTATLHRRPQLRPSAQDLVDALAGR